MMMTMINNGELWKQFSGYYTIQFPPHIPISWSPFDFGWMMMMKIIVMMVFMIMIMHKIWIVIITKIFFTYFLLCVDRERKKPRSLSAWSRVTWIWLRWRLWLWRKLSLSWWSRWSSKSMIMAKSFVHLRLGVQQLEYSSHSTLMTTIMMMTIMITPPNKWFYMGHHLFHTVNSLTSTIKPSIVFLVEQTCWLIKVNNCHPDNFELKFVLKDNFNCDFHIYDQSIYRSGYSVHSFLSFGSVSQRACNSIYKE